MTGGDPDYDAPVNETGKELVGKVSQNENASNRENENRVAKILNDKDHEILSDLDSVPIHTKYGMKEKWLSEFTHNDELFDINTEKNKLRISPNMDDTSVFLQNKAFADNRDRSQNEQRKINVISVHTVKHSDTSVNEGVNKALLQKRIYPAKDQFCRFCNKTVKRFGRHLTLVHNNEDEVKKILKFEKKTIERIKVIDALRARGNYIFNHRATETKEQIVARRALNKAQPNIYTDCPSCLMRLSKISLCRPQRNKRQ